MDSYNGMETLQFYISSQNLENENNRSNQGNKQTCYLYGLTLGKLV
jgi:hypothetical protein